MNMIPAILVATVCDWKFNTALTESMTDGIEQWYSRLGADSVMIAVQFPIPSNFPSFYQMGLA